MAWSKRQKDRAVQDGKGLLEVKASGKHLGKGDRIGAVEFTCPMDQSTAFNIAVLAMHVHKGKTPAEAFDLAFSPVPSRKEEDP